MTVSPHRPGGQPAAPQGRDPAEPARDRQAVTPAGESLEPLPEGVSFHEITGHVAERGAVCELFDLRWGWHAAARRTR